jgi:hypothetical protein
MKLQKE